MKRNAVLLVGLLFAAIVHKEAFAQTNDAFRDAALPAEVRAKALIKALTLEEKISLLGYNSPGVARLGIPSYNWWNEALHGVARAGRATVFPQAIGLAATFNDSLLNTIAKAISTEARAKYNLAVARDNRLQYMGLTFWSPNINLFRDPRWGRGQETYGEDPYLTAKMGVAFVTGMQGDHPTLLKTATCAKHFAVHSGPEEGRHSFNAVVDEKDLRESYLYAFKALVDNGVESVMCAYNRVNGEPCCTGPTLLRKILREEWNFKGHVVTDCWALEDIWKRHKVMNDAAEVAAAAVKGGINMDCSNLLQDDLDEALKRGLITEADIDAALIPAIRTQVRLGFFDTTPGPFSALGEESVHPKMHVDLARKAAQQSMVLLKNKDNILPLDPSRFETMLISGTNAASLDALVANYHGVSNDMVTFVEGIVDAAPVTMGIQYDLGCDYADTTRFGGIWASGNSDVTVVVIGLSPVLEGEEGDAFLAKNGGDRADLELPESHIAYIKAIRKSHRKPLIAVITAGSAINVAAIEPYVDAVILAWYPGEQGGHALADILFGKISPSGRLPVTFHHSANDLPRYEDYSMRSRTYRYYKGDVQYPFGFGLSYTTFGYRWNEVPRSSYTSRDSIRFSVTVTNTGTLHADEVLQVYIGYPGLERMPVKELKAFRRVTIPAGKQKTVAFSIPVNELKKWDLNRKAWKIYAGDYTVVVGRDSGNEALKHVIRIRERKP